MTNGYPEQQPLSESQVWGVGIADNSNNPKPLEFDTTAMDVKALFDERKAKKDSGLGEPCEGRR